MNKVIKEEIDSFPTKHHFLKNESNDFIFDAVSVKSIFYKNPSIPCDDDLLKSDLVDGPNDNGFDAIVTDDTSDHGDMVFVQCKYYESIAPEDIKDALNKMISAYRSLLLGKFELFNSGVGVQYPRCLDNMEEGAKIRFCFVTSAPRNGLKDKTFDNFFDTAKGDLNIELDDLFFENEIVDSINDAKTLRPNVEFDKLKYENEANMLTFCDSCVVNISAFSLKTLYSKYRNGLLAQNLRYYVKHKTIDRDVEMTINNDPGDFWYKNNGITIICDKYDVSGNEIKLWNFSVINGGQTTRKIFDSSSVNAEKDFFLLCRIIVNPYSDPNEKQNFIFEVAKATNSQKAIKPSDLKANNPEQTLFAAQMMANNVYYKTKRGTEIPSEYKTPNKNCDLQKAGKLALAGMFLMPGTSRNRPSIIFDEDKDFYDVIFNKKTNSIVAAYLADLLYVDSYFDRVFISSFKEKTLSKDKNLFAGNCRTLCLAFVGFLAKYYSGEFDESDLMKLANANADNEDSVKTIQKILRKMDKTTRIFNSKLSLDERDKKLDECFIYIINKGYSQYKAYKDNQDDDSQMDESGWLKKDSNFYKIIALLADDIAIDGGPLKPLVSDEVA